MSSFAAHMNELLDCLHRQQQPAGGLAFPAVWQTLNLDYTPDSIKRINRLLYQIRTSSEYTSRVLQQNPSGVNFIHTIAAYLANYLANQSGIPSEWYDDGSIGTGTTLYHVVQAVCNAIDKPNSDINLDKPLWQLLCFGVEADKSQLKQLILDRFLQKRPIPEGLAHQSALSSITFDFSENSLQQIDKLVALLAKHYQLRPESVRRWAVQNSSHRNFFLLLGFYIGETVARQLGQTIMWNPASRLAEIIQQPVSADFFDSIVADLGNGVVTPILNIVEQMFSNPAVSSQGWLNYLREEETDVAEYQPNFIDMNQVARRTVDGFLRGVLPDGRPMPEVAYADDLREMNLDYSEASVAKLDKLLKIIRVSQPEFTRFAAAPHTQNFLHFCAFYLARTAALVSHNSLKFLSYQEAKQFQPALSNEFFHRYAALIGGKLFFPLQQITAQIWQPNQPLSGVEFIQEISQQYCGALIQSAPKTDFTGINLPFEWKLALKAAGFGLSWALWEKRQQVSDLLTPTLVQPDGAGINLLKLNTNDIQESMYSGRHFLKKNPDRLPHQAFLYESFANLPQGRFDAIAIELCVYQGKQSLYLFALLPFIDDGKSLINGSIAINGETLEQPDLAESVIQTLYQGMDDFFTPQHNTPRLWWRQSWQEHL